jgi:Anti-sigma factor NepR
MSAALLKPLMEYAECRTGGPSYYQRTLGTAIGRELRSYYDLSESIPDHMLKLLKQLDDAVKPDGSTAAAEESSLDPRLRPRLDVQSPDANQLLFRKGSEPASTTTTSDISFGSLRLLPA